MRRWPICIILVMASSFVGDGAATFSWSEWSNDVRCARNCSQPVGLTMFTRDCMNCSAVGVCEVTSRQHCKGNPEKIESCYVATHCQGSGPYVGQWTAWTRSGKCPPSHEPCHGVHLQYNRKCVLPEVYGQRSEEFQCPGDQSVHKVAGCPCGERRPIEWSAWTKCIDPCNDRQHRIRHRICPDDDDPDCNENDIQMSLCPIDPDRCVVLRKNRRRKREVIVTHAAKQKVEEVNIRWKVRGTGAEAKEDFVGADLPPWVVPIVGASAALAIVLLAVCLATVGIHVRDWRHADVETPPTARTPLVVGPPSSKHRLPTRS